MAIYATTAFDCISYQLLLQKLKLYNTSNETFKWFGSYLSSRTQYVAQGALTSNMVAVQGRVPQGSILGPVMYNL